MTTREWYAADADDQDRTRPDTTVWRDRGTIIAAQQARIAELETECDRLANVIRDAANDPTLRLGGHSGISIRRLRARAERETS